VVEIVLRGPQDVAGEGNVDCDCFTRAAQNEIGQGKGIDHARECSDRGRRRSVAVHHTSDSDNGNFMTGSPDKPFYVLWVARENHPSLANG